MRISDWSSDVCSSDLMRPCSSSTATAMTSPLSSPTPSSGGTRPRPPRRSSCSWAATCSTSASTARSSAPSPARRSSPWRRSRWPERYPETVAEVPADEALFTYGTLQLPDVQRDTFGRLLQGEEDVLAGYTADYVELDGDNVVEVSG